MLKFQSVKQFLPKNIRNIHACARIGNRDVVGHGHNGSYNYKDDAHFPFPAIRFRENDFAICSLRQREMGDWKCLSCDEKRALYRASFCQTFAEFQHGTGTWKFVLGLVFVTTSFGMWCLIFARTFINEPMPTHLCEENQKHQLRRMLELRVNPIDGLSSHWDYDNDRWK